MIPTEVLEAAKSVLKGTGFEKSQSANWQDQKWTVDTAVQRAFAFKLKGDDVETLRKYLQKRPYHSILTKPEGREYEDGNG